MADAGVAAEKVREKRLRRMARRRGMLLRKSRRRDPEAGDFGMWYLVDPYTNALLRECPDILDVESEFTT